MNVKKNVLNPLNLLVLLIALACFTSCEKDDDTVVEETIIEENLPDITGFPVVGTNQTMFFDNSSETTTQSSGDEFYGQTPFLLLQYQGNLTASVVEGWKCVQTSCFFV